MHKLGEDSIATCFRTLEKHVIATAAAAAIDASVGRRSAEIAA